MGNSEFDDVAAHLLEPEESLDSEQQPVSTWTKAIYPPKARENWGQLGAHCQ